MLLLLLPQKCIIRRCAVGCSQPSALTQNDSSTKDVNERKYLVLFRKKKQEIFYNLTHERQMFEDNLEKYNNNKKHESIMAAANTYAYIEFYQ